MKNVIFALFVLSTIAFAETKVAIYSVPFGMVGEVNQENFRAFEKRIEALPAQSFSLNDKDVVIAGDGITIALDNKQDRVGNFNRLLAALYSYSKNTPGIDSAAVKQAVSVLSAHQQSPEGNE